MDSTTVITHEHLPVGRVAHRTEVYGVDGSRRALRPARPANMRTITEPVRPYTERRVLIAKNLISYFRNIQEFTVAEKIPGIIGPGGAGSGGTSAVSRIMGCRTLHVMWDDIAEVRTLATHPDALGTRFGSTTLYELIAQTREMGLKRVFYMTFEKQFFGAHDFKPIEDAPVDADVFAEMLRSHDDSLAEFPGLVCVKPNTLGNARMLLHL